MPDIIVQVTLTSEQVEALNRKRHDPYLTDPDRYVDRHFQVQSEITNQVLDQLPLPVDHDRPQLRLVPLQ